MENGFYTVVDDQLDFGQMVSFADGTVIVLELKDTYTYPIEGWYYFDTELEAKIFFNLPLEEAND